MGLLGCLTALALAQQGVPPDEMELHASAYIPPSQYALKTETRLVEVGVVVREANGHTVGGLTRDDFEVEDGGKKREITAFNAEVAAPPVRGCYRGGSGGSDSGSDAGTIGVGRAGPGSWHWYSTI